MLTLAIGTLAWLAYGFILDLTLLGYDSYPLIACARFDSISAAWNSLTSELMQGRYSAGEYWRPLTIVSFGLDRAWYGLSARGYHLTDLLLLCGNCLALALFVRRFSPGHGWSAAALAALIFLLHPLQLEVVPVPPRRADTLALFFTLCTLNIWLAPQVTRSAWLRLALASFCAATAKEIGFLLGPLVLVLALLSGSVDWRTSLRRSLCVLAALVFAFCLRTLVLGGIGGRNAPADERSLLSRACAFSAEYLERVLHPQPIWQDAALARSYGLVVALGLGLSAGWLSRHDKARSKRYLFLLAWAIGALLLSSFAGLVEAWYALLFAALWSLFSAQLYAHALSAWSAKRFLPAGIALLFLLTSTTMALRYSSLWQPYTDWLRASAMAVSFREKVGQAYDQALPGGPALEVPGFVPRFPEPPPTAVAVQSIVLHTDYSLAAWLELTRPQDLPHVERRPGALLVARTKRAAPSSSPGE